MASHSEHVIQAKSNLDFLVKINKLNPAFWDWQVTTAFYVAVHLVNSHLAHVANLHYQTHEQVKNMLNPHNQLSICQLPQDLYLDYVKLEGLSRRSRYLCGESRTAGDPNEVARITVDKHLARSIKCLDRLITHFDTLYSIGFTQMEIACIELKKTPLQKFKIS